MPSSGKNAPELLEIDGSYGEGGGEILRNCIAYSTILKKPIRVSKIRAGRPKPGLRPQHLHGILLAQKLCNADVFGCSENSTEVDYFPNILSGGTCVADTKTAGSVTLLLQTALPCMLFGNRPCSVTLKGGTNADMAPQVDFVNLVLKPVVEKIGINFDLRVNKRGYFPKGGGEIRVETDPIKIINSVKLTKRGNVQSVYGRCFVAGVLPFKFAQDLRDETLRLIRHSKLKEIVNFNTISINIEAVQERNAVGNGSGIQLVVTTDEGCYFSGSSLGNRNKTGYTQIAESAVDELMENLLTNTNACVDKFLQDQLIIFMALGSGSSALRCGPLTSHTKTAIEMAEKMTGVKFCVQNIDGSTNDCLVSCEGISMTNCFFDK